MYCPICGNTVIEEAASDAPVNDNLEAKIRRQLQLSGNNGFVKFTSRGNCQKTGL
ncbi:MAG: hypothetical protein ACI3Z7_06875 [Candidatus Aphodosoma sp.]